MILICSVSLAQRFLTANHSTAAQAQLLMRLLLGCFKQRLVEDDETPAKNLNTEITINWEHPKSVYFSRTTLSKT